MWQTWWDAVEWLALTGLGVSVGGLVCMWLIEPWLAAGTTKHKP